MTLTQLNDALVDETLAREESEAGPSLQDFARQLAENQPVHWVAARRRLPILAEPKVAEGLLRRVHLYFAQLAEQELVVSYAGEWILDNFYLIQQALRQIEEDMPDRFYRRLPTLAAAPLEGYPRVYALARALIAATDCHFTVQQIQEFVEAYQQRARLTLGELWALPAMLRICVLELLLQTSTALADLEKEEGWAAVEAYELSESIAPESIVANGVMSLRLLGVQDWKTFFEDVSWTERVLRRDPLGVYERMDFETRNRYREVVETLALAIGQDEDVVAGVVVELAQVASRQDGKFSPAWGESAEDRAAHVGYYLIDAGRPALETALGYRPSISTRARRRLSGHPVLVYLGSISILALAIMLGVIGFLQASGATAAAVLTSGIVTLVPAFAAAISVVNWAASHLLKPRVLPKMDFSEGIPSACQTIVVIPALLTDAAEVESLAQQLELHFLRNEDPNLRFALLADFDDAPQQHVPGDEKLLSQMTGLVNTLNERYRQSSGSPFYCFVRERRWNPSENVWMGWERKRGKLSEFNHLLLEGAQGSFTVLVGDLDALSEMRYVITLDADTVLPKGSARRLVGTFAHPLNRAVFSPDGNEVVAGYTVLQPRIETLPVAANRSPFARIFAGENGLDLYTLAVSDTYQDLFGEGIYTGKGIYDVAAFERSLVGRVPENALLSHDLFEGLHGRAALATDTVLLEDYPSHYLAYARRQQRWIRGDWQLLPWLLPRVPREGGGTMPNSLSLLDRWKIADNLRRSLFRPALLTLLILGWMALPGSALAWTLIVMALASIPFLIGMVNPLSQALSSGQWSAVGRQGRVALERWLHSLVFLPYEALLSLDAIGTTLYRLARRKRLLQWTTAANTWRLLRNHWDARSMRLQMLEAQFFVMGLLLSIGLLNPPGLIPAVPFLAVWLLSPQVASRISRPRRRQATALSPRQQQMLRTLARRTWLFFEQFIGPEDHWLPPDHYQQTPRGIVAHQTSPTNIGLLLISTLAAHDFGYIGLMELGVRLRSTFEGMDALERYRGHFLNWYNTQTLEPLPPRYVSTVDSGNLAGCLLALKYGLSDLNDAPILGVQRWAGLLDTMSVMDDLLSRLRQATSDAQFAEMQARLDDIRRDISAWQDEPAAWNGLLIRLLENDWPQLGQLLVALMEAAGPGLDVALLSDLRIYLERSRAQLVALRRDMDVLLPWLLLFDLLPALFIAPDSDPAVREAWHDLVGSLPVVSRLSEIAAITRAGQERLTLLLEALEKQDGQAGAVREAQAWCRRLAAELDSARINATGLLVGFAQLSQSAEAYFDDMDFSFLFDAYRKLFHIGYNVATEQLDNSYYDLLASEARLASYLAIGKGDVPQEHWLHLGRPLTQIDGGQALLSWSGTMFEYLMPWLLVRHYDHTLLDQSCRLAVEHQIAYGRQKAIPWGISEAGYYAFDSALNYQYRAFGAPRLAFKRGLSADLVIAPYASLIALPVDPQAVLENVERLIDARALGTYGFYEAIDYTPGRLPLGQEQALVQEYMAHHQGMIFVALANHLIDSVMRRRFHADPRVQSIELLLQERIPQQVYSQPPAPEESPAVTVDQAKISLAPWTASPDAPVPLVQYLSNGRYSVLITNAGGGYSQWKDTALTRWRADTTLDDWGTWVYALDRDGGQVWSIGSQPTATIPDSRETLFSAHKVEFRRRDYDISLHMEVAVAPDDDVEVRTITVTNHSSRPRRLLLASYAEVVMSPQGNDLRHPAFNKMFAESEYLPHLKTLLFRRRPRSAHEAPIYMAHTLVTGPDQVGSVRVETDRAAFLGRGRTPRAPAALLERGGDLTGTVGATLDPILCIGLEIDLEPYSSTRVAYLTAAGDSRQQVEGLAAAYQNWRTIERAFQQSRYQSERELLQLSLGTSELENMQKLLSALLYPSPPLRADPAMQAANTQSQPGLWAYGISGDYPILLVRIGDETQLELIHELLQAHFYWRNRGLKITLIILNQRDTGYNQELYNQVHHLIVRMGGELWINRHDGIFLLRADQIPDAGRILLQAAARVYLDAQNGPLARQVEPLLRQPVRLPAFVPVSGATGDETTPPVERPTDLRFDNGWGGFSADGREYVVYLEPGEWTPAPWISVIANPDFGFIVSEVGSGFSWQGNSSENRLTVWRNDPVGDAPGEAIYLRDEETAQVWSPTPLPAGDSAPYRVRHGAGYSIFEHRSHGLDQRLRLFAASDDPVKIVHLRLENLGDRPRRITVTSYSEWVLGTVKDVTQQYVIPDFDAETQTLLARNPYSIEFGRHVAFVAANKTLHGLTADRTEFLGSLGSAREPAALKRIGLSGTVRAGLDPCAAVQLHVDLPPGGVEEVYFLIGQGETREAALRIAQQYREEGRVEQAWQAVTAFWENLLSSVTIQTPDPAMDVLFRWLLYQTLSCRVWGRSALYQSGGAFGFRDQLQDVMALLHARPDLVREHILRAARHQFDAGDVLHWWHPPSGRGVRTRFADDLLWLPYVTAAYIEATGDEGILKEQVPFLTGEPLRPEEDERYGFYETTDETRSLYEHCRRALDRGFTSGPHGLPLMGSGDWNDGMNRVGIGGRGESVWMGWFLCATMTRFAPLCEKEGDADTAALLRQRVDSLRAALEEHAWDGDWYLRAFYDDGTPLGSHRNDECRIDSIAQSWGILSGAADPERARGAMAAVDEHLIDEENRLIRLFTPPFNFTDHDPGYIKGYPPGIRENGGQYTHAALWTVWALAEMGQGDRAAALFGLLNPITHGDTREKAQIYAVEPYVIAADVYGAAPHTGHGGWTWYTGSSGWMYRLALEAILGIRRRGRALHVDPCIPRDWPGFEVVYRCGETPYHITVENESGMGRGVREVSIDGQSGPPRDIPLIDDGERHEVHIRL